MDYYVVETVYVEKSPTELSVSPPITPDELVLGDKLAVPPPLLVIQLSTLKGVLDIWDASSYLLMSEKALQPVRELGEPDIQEFPVSLRTRSEKRDDKGTRIVHLVGRVDCLDKERSDFETAKDNDNQICAIHSLALDTGRIPANRHLFRLRGYPTIIIASEALVECWLAAEVRGAKFLKPGTYQRVAYSGNRHRPKR